ncbi:homeobox protein Hox-B4a-like [Tachypleus tridentatus]|uniref:homeobox protein Hox-B4a-like n=1 Tax=Tachypleus tridentatus TaxID=6853 RepID=UPI003FD21768
MTMSSFLMSSVPHLEPKFPPHEEYHETSYISSDRGDYFGHPYRHSAVNSQHAPVSYGHEHSSHNTAFTNHGSVPQCYPPPCSLSQNSVNSLHKPKNLVSPTGYVPPSIGPNHVLQGPARQSPRTPLPQQAPPALTTDTPREKLSVEPIPDCAVSTAGPPVIYPWMKKSTLIQL